EQLGDRVLAVTVESELYPQWQSDDAAKLAATLGIRHEVVRASELGIDRFAENPPDRCYWCKRELFSHMGEIARREGFEAVADGANADDPHDHRPGLRAAAELGVRSPLREAGITKEMVREISRKLGLPTWSKPAFACLASRFPYGLHITHERLEMVRRAEEVLRSIGLAQFRVRHHDTIARIEVPSEEVARLASPEMRAELVRTFKEIGYLYVTLDLEGFRSGSMNAVLRGREREES
ncbi:MAG TPA: ATP-dependent sacrificial sulfur transferase LarE, partial [Planctomycetota bacterium]|nr:ATP-dependent sacrificial sulfur transferase LarE [Planctomycetota bacterium]